MANLGYIQVSRECNLNCIICSNPPTDRSLSFEDAKKEVDALVQKNCEGIILSGGEPTLYPHLPELIEYCLQRGVFPRIITNGQKISDIEYLRRLKSAGLQHFHLSVYSCRPEIEAKITKSMEAFKNIEQSLSNISTLGGITVDINIVINAYNADHLCETVSWLIDRYGMIRHFVFNNLDPCMNRVADNPEVVPRLNSFELELHKALNVLASREKTFRVERVPLCYLTGFEHASTETRKIVMKEQRMIYFLDERGAVQQEDWYYKKGACCAMCFLDKICAGLYASGKGYDERELSPVFIDPEPIIKKIQDS